MSPLLQQLLRRADSPGAVKARVLRCLSSWVLLDVPLNESEDLVHDSFSALTDPELFDTAVEAIVNAISQPDSQRWAPAVTRRDDATGCRGAERRERNATGWALRGGGRNKEDGEEGA